ncbi:MAG TPA: hypothetical protein VFL91_19960 [Thermomicrobiales bacterium]|nr:hypothetical protein [Thermomicrobiales bacterium]
MTTASTEGAGADEVRIVAVDDGDPAPVNALLGEGWRLLACGVVERRETDPVGRPTSGARCTCILGRSRGEAPAVHARQPPIGQDRRRAQPALQRPRRARAVGAGRGAGAARFRGEGADARRSASSLTGAILPGASPAGSRLGIIPCSWSGREAVWASRARR